MWNCCGDVMLKFSSLGLSKDIACFTIHPEATLPSSYTFVACRREPLNRSYFKSALRFLREVAVEQRKNRGERNDVAMRLLWVIDADASLPRELQQELKSLNVFILAHQSCSCQTSTSSIATSSSRRFGTCVNARFCSMNANLTYSGEARRLV